MHSEARNGSAQAQEETPDSNSAELKARQLLYEILPPAAAEEFRTKGFFSHKGKIGLYRISRSSQTEVYLEGRLAALSCLQLTIFAPSYDRMIAEYLILNSDETLYWNKANVFPAQTRKLDLSVPAMFVIDLALILNLVLNYLV